MTKTYVPNLRDIGGLGLAGGGSVLAGQILRSGAPIADDLAPDNIRWPPTTIVDLRSAGERQASHPLSHHGPSIHSLPLLASLRPGVALPDQLADLYLMMVKNSADHLVNLVDIVADASGPVLIHCSAGKDRTGISVALLLRLLGASREDVVADYLRTRDHEEEIEARFELLLGSNRAKLPPAYFTVVPDAIERVLDVWDVNTDGVVGWYEQAGGDTRTVEKLRSRLVVT